ncbi:hypothetical protein ACWDOP_03655 [Nocardia sp. NPDC003693]
MGAFTMIKEVPGTPEDLFDTIIRPTTWEHWFTLHHDCVGCPPDTLADGATLRSEVLLFGVTAEVEWTVPVRREPDRIVLQGKAHTGLRCEFDYWFHRTGTGVTITAGSIFTAPSMKRAVAQALEERGRDELDRTLAQLAALATARER